jgi:hypothetical protein
MVIAIIVMCYKPINGHTVYILKLHVLITKSEVDIHSS